MNAAELRQKVTELVSTARAGAALAQMRLLWWLEPSAATAGFINRHRETLRHELSLRPHRLAILRSFTIEPLVPLLQAAALVHGIDLEVKIGEFNAYAQEIFDPSSHLYSGNLDSVILAVQLRDIAPELWHGYTDLTADRVNAAIANASQQFAQWISAFRQHSKAALIVHTLEVPPDRAAGVLDSQLEIDQQAAIGQINTSIRQSARRHEGVFVLDYDMLVAREGRGQWHDEKKWLTVRLPIASSNLATVVAEWMRYLVPLSGKTGKVLVVDLDNTLWGGVIGEEGFNGIALGAEYPGAAFQRLQRVMLDLRQRGVLLAICSKNNPDDAAEVLERHPGMLLRPEHFVAKRINWQDKATNLKELAAELNIGTDAMVFLDDHPVEREHIRQSMPEVWVLEPPTDPIGFAASVYRCPLFERLTISEEDKNRSSYYAAQQVRAHLEAAAPSKEEFYRSLEQQIDLEPLTAPTLVRVAQLTQKTNQFNLTTRRYTEQQISQFAAEHAYAVVAIRVKDRYGDNGIVGVAITRDVEQSCEIDTLLLSCRVIGRTVETALLAHLVASARARGMKTLQGWFYPTKKNAPAAKFYADHGFQQVATGAEGSLWSLKIDEVQLNCPQWIKFNSPESADEWRVIGAGANDRR